MQFISPTAGTKRLEIEQNLNRNDMANELQNSTRNCMISNYSDEEKKEVKKVNMFYWIEQSHQE